VFKETYPLGTWVSSPGGKAAHLHLVPRSMREAIPSVPNTPSWHGVQLKPRDNFTFTFLTYVFSLREGDDVFAPIRNTCFHKHCVLCHN